MGELGTQNIQVFSAEKNDAMLITMMVVVAVVMMKMMMMVYQSHFVSPSHSRKSSR